MSSLVSQGLAKLCAKRRELFAKHGGYPASATYLLSVLAVRRWFSLVLFSDGERPPEWDQSFDPIWLSIPPAVPLSGKASLGTAIEGEGTGHRGSIGWNVLFNGRDALVTNRHVVVSSYSSPNTPKAATVSSYPTGSAEIVWSPIMASTTPATFDVAICSYINGEGERRSDCGGTAGYPTAFASDLDAATDRFEFAGATTGCSSGQLLAVADVLVNYDGNRGGHIWMQNQLIFNLPCDGGDSGSLIKRSGDNAAAALLCARSKKHKFAIANPLFLIDWDVTPNGPGDLPRVDLRHPVPAGVPVWKAPQQILECGDDAALTSTADTSSSREDGLARLAFVQSLPK